MAYYLADEDVRAVGRALYWAQSNGAVQVEILAAGPPSPVAGARSVASDLARRASLLSAPEGDGAAVRVWATEGATAVPAQPGPVAVPPVLPAAYWALAGLITEAGARPIDDNGQLVAEVAGLEVGRVVVPPSLDGDAAPTIEVGVGQADRELSTLVHTGDDVNTGLRRVVAAVVQHRRGHGDSHHPLSRLARERWLRALVLDRPELVDAAELSPLVPLRPRQGLVRAEPSAAAGTLRSGQPVVVVAMVGIDLDLIPEAADYRARWNPEAAIVLVLPERDLALNTRLLPRLPRATVVGLVPPWSTLV